METIIMINNNDVKSLAHTKWNSFGKRRWDDRLVIADALLRKSPASRPPCCSFGKLRHELSNFNASIKFSNIQPLLFLRQTSPVSRQIKRSKLLFIFRHLGLVFSAKFAKYLLMMSLSPPVFTTIIVIKTQSIFTDTKYYIIYFYIELLINKLSRSLKVF